MIRAPDATTRRPPAASLRHFTVIVLVVLLAMYASSTPSLANVGLGTADSFAVLGGSTITNTGPTTITGDVGLHPGTAVTGFGSVTLNGQMHVNNAVAEQAKVDLVTAYNDAAGRTPVSRVATQLGGQTLKPGVYDSADGTFGITGTLTLDAEGNPNAVFVFKTASTLTSAASSNVSLINGADVCNVFWQVGTSATLGTNSSFTGTIMALTSITLTTGANVQGRVLARNGAVTMDTNIITRTACTEPSAEPTPTPSPTETPGDTDTVTPPDDGAVTPPDDGAVTPPDDGAVTPPDDDGAPPTTVQPPTRVDTGAGGTAPPVGLPGIAFLLALILVGGTIAWMRRGSADSS